MEQLHSSNKKCISRTHNSENLRKLGITEFQSEHINTQSVVENRTDADPYGFNAINIKEEDLDENTNELNHPSMDFQQSSVIMSSSQIKLDSNQLMSSGVPVVSQGMQISTSGNVLVSQNDGSHKILQNHQTMLPLGHTVNFGSSSNFNTITQGSNLVASSQNNNIIGQPVQMFQSNSYDNCEGMLNQHQRSGQAFLLAPPGTVLSPNQMVSQGQVLLHGEELVGYSIANSDAHYVNTGTLSMVHSGQTIGNNPTRLILQANHPGSSSINSPVLPTNNGHYLIQVGNAMPALSSHNSNSNSNFSISNKGHIVIKAGGSKVKVESQDFHTSNSKDGVFRVIIPEGTTKLPKLTQPVQQDDGNTDESVRKHVQINLSNRNCVQSHYDTGVQTQLKGANSHRKLYECKNCNSKFIKPLYHRMHMRSCKKPEIKNEKAPLYMCSFCKTIFKTKPLIRHHFSKCSHSPYFSKDTVGKRKLEDDEDSSSNKKGKFMELDPVLEQAVQYKCQDCDRTFNKERQYTSHIKRCTKVSVHDLSGARAEAMGDGLPEEEHDSLEDPFADPPLPPPPAKRGRGGGGRRGRPPGRVGSSTLKTSPKNNILFEGEKVQAICSGLIVADNENLVRSTTGLAHTVQLSLETAQQEGQPQPTALVADSKGVRGREKPPHAWSLVCSLCQKMFLTKAALANHVIDNHGPDLRVTQNILKWKSVDEKNLFRCPVCDLHYQSSNHFLEHLVTQHTTKLQEYYRNLQSQTASFICSLCSIVLLTKNLLMEHLSLEHLDDLEKTHFVSETNRKKREKLGLLEGNQNIAENHNCIGDHQVDENADASLELKSEDNLLECGFCGEEMESQELLVNHYTQNHSVETDADGVLLDLGMDVDIRVKDTKSLIQLADGKVDDHNLPEKTVLIRKKPKQSWQCQSCQQVFTRQMTWLRHVREVCHNNTLDSSKSSGSRESHFFCQEPECSHLAFYQVKSLFKHKEEVHKITVKKERKTFKSLSLFYQWLTSEEKKFNVRFIRDSTRVEKSNVRLIQMVCHRFHSAKVEQAKEKEESDLSKPTKKRWFVRIQRANNCHARIHLRVEYNESSKDYDGETQMIYYPEHFHNGEEDSPELLDKIVDRHPRNKTFSTKNNGFVEGDSGSSFSLDSTSDLIMQAEETSITTAAGTTIQVPHNYVTGNSSGLLMSSRRSNFNNATNNAIIMSSDHNLVSEANVILPHTSALTSQNSMVFQGNPVSSNDLMIHTNGETRFIVPNEVTNHNHVNKPAHMDGGDVGTYMVMNVDHQRPNESETTQEFSEEYVLPADDSEWTKLFNVLNTRISTGELTGDDKKEGEALLTYENLIGVISLSEQVSIFQRMCSLTNTSLESV